MNHIQAIDTKKSDDSAAREMIAGVLKQEPILDGAILLYFDGEGRANMSISGMTNAEKAYLLYFMQMNLTEAIKG